MNSTSRTGRILNITGTIGKFVGYSALVFLMIQTLFFTKTLDWKIWIGVSIFILQMSIARINGKHYIENTSIVSNLFSLIWVTGVTWFEWVFATRDIFWVINLPGVVTIVFGVFMTVVVVISDNISNNNL